MERSEKLFKEFIDLCREVTHDDVVVLELLQKRYNGTNLHFLWSDDFPDLVERCSQKILADRDNKYVYIKEFTTELKAYKAKPLKHLRETDRENEPAGKRGASSDQGRAAKRPRLGSADGENAHSRMRSPILCAVGSPSCSLIPLSMMSKMVTETPKSATGAVEENGNDPGKDGATKGELKSPIKVDQVSDLNLPEIVIRIEKCEVPHNSGSLNTSSACVSLIDCLYDPEPPLNESPPPEQADSENNGACSEDVETERNERRERRNQRNIDRLEALLKKISEEIERLQETELSLEDLDKEDSSYTLEDRYKKRFVKVWHRLCQLKGRQTTTGRETERNLNYAGTNYPEINRRISRFINKFRTFPDYSDIHGIIEKCNKKHNLRIRKRTVDQLAQTTFTDVGNILQKRRLVDFAENSGCHLTDNLRPSDDPAWFDSSLRQKLDTNMKISKSKLEEVINKFAQKQEVDGDEEDDEEEDDEEEEKEEEEEDDQAIADELVLTDDMEGTEETETDANESQEEATDKTSETVELTEGIVVESPPVEIPDDQSNDEEETIDRSADGTERDETSTLPSLDLSGDEKPEEEKTEVKAQTESQDIIVLPVKDVVDCVELDETDKDTLTLSGDSECSRSPSTESFFESKPLADEMKDDTRLQGPVCCSPLQQSPLKSSCESAQSSPELPSDSARQTDESNRGPPPPSPSGAVMNDVICLDDDVLSPMKSGMSDSGTDSAASFARDLSKISDLVLDSVKLNVPTASAIKNLVRNGLDSSCSALVLRQSTKQPIDSAALLSDDDDVIVINSGNTPSKETPTFKASEVNGTRARSESEINGIGEECCILQTVEEEVVSSVVTHNSASGDRVTQQTMVTKRVIGHIVCFNAPERRIAGAAAACGSARTTNCATQQTTRTVRLNQKEKCFKGFSRNSPNKTRLGLQRPFQSTRPTVNQPGRPCDGKKTDGVAPSSVGRVKPRVRPQNRFNLDLDKISREIASSVFKNAPQRSSSQEPDVILCDGPSALGRPQPTLDGRTPDRSNLGLRTERSSTAKTNNHSVAKFSDSRPGSSLRSKVDSDSAAVRPLKQKNSQISEVIELD